MAPCAEDVERASETLKGDQAKRLKELEKENTPLKCLVADLALEKQVLREAAQGNS
jgi:cell division protein FtsB